MRLDQHFSRRKWGWKWGGDIKCGLSFSRTVQIERLLLFKEKTNHWSLQPAGPGNCYILCCNLLSLKGFNGCVNRTFIRDFCQWSHFEIKGISRFLFSLSIPSPPPPFPSSLLLVSVNPSIIPSPARLAGSPFTALSFIRESPRLGYFSAPWKATPHFLVYWMKCLIGVWFYTFD